MGRNPKKGGEGSKNGSRGGDPNRSCVFSTLPLLVCLSVRYLRREQIADIENDLATRCQKSFIQSLFFQFFHTLFEA